MTIALWVLQVLLALAFVFAGTLHGFRYERAKAQLPWVAAVPRGLLTFIGVCEILAGVGLILPAATHILPWLTPLAATGLVVIMILAVGFHASRREYRGIVTNAVLLAVAAFVAYGRWILFPF